MLSVNSLRSVQAPMSICCAPELQPAEPLLGKCSFENRHECSRNCLLDAEQSVCKRNLTPHHAVSQPLQIPEPAPLCRCCRALCFEGFQPTCCTPCHPCTSPQCSPWTRLVAPAPQRRAPRKIVPPPPPHPLSSSCEGCQAAENPLV